jgi:hypothetical protein
VPLPYVIRINTQRDYTAASHNTIPIKETCPNTSCLTH